MSCERAQELLVERLQGPLAPADATWLENHLASCDGCRGEAGALAATWADLAAVAAPEPGPWLRARFRRELALEAAAAAPAPARPHRAWRHAAAAVALLATGALVGGGVAHRRGNEDLAALRSEVRSLNTTVALTLLRQNSAGERLLGAQFGGRAADDATVVGALLETVRQDSSVNVRLAALDALARIADRPDVQRHLLAGIGEQPSPMAQAAIADLLLAHGSPTVRERLVRLAEGDQLDPAVREHLRRALARST